MDDFDPTKPIGRDNFPMFTAPRGGIQYRRDSVEWRRSWYVRAWWRLRRRCHR